ncbi:MAG TPA: hypothetical protein VMN36_16780 [Verrucomicrobiales bacterium]|nr:hypothetical protein [Verrucomicrobiales bacterium]
MAFPFDPSTLGIDSLGNVSLSPRIIAPAAGAVIDGDTAVVATAASVEALEWSLDYAVVDLVDPYALAMPDDDYVLLSEGSGFLANKDLGPFPGSLLPDGVYFLRLAARLAAGGATSYTGQVVAVGVPEAEFRPVITLTQPEPNVLVPLSADLSGSIWAIPRLTAALNSPASPASMNARLTISSVSLLESLTSSGNPCRPAPVK